MWGDATTRSSSPNTTHGEHNTCGRVNKGRGGEREGRNTHIPRVYSFGAPSLEPDGETRKEKKETVCTGEEQEKKVFKGESSAGLPRSETHLLSRSLLGEGGDSCALDLEYDARSAGRWIPHKR